MSGVDTVSSLCDRIAELLAEAAECDRSAARERDWEAHCAFRRKSRRALATARDLQAALARQLTSEVWS